MSEFDRACAQVGRFMYHFAELENQIDAALAKLFELKEPADLAIAGSVDFYQKKKLVSTYALDQLSNSHERARVERLLNKVGMHNDARNVVAHSRFEPAGDGVKFTQVKR